MKRPKKIDSGELILKHSKAESELLQTAVAGYLQLVEQKFPDTRIPSRVRMLLKKIVKTRDAGLEVRRELRNAHTRHTRAAVRMLRVTEQDVPR